MSGGEGDDNRNIVRKVAATLTVPCAILFNSDGCGIGRIPDVFLFDRLSQQPAGVIEIAGLRGGFETGSLQARGQRALCYRTVCNCHALAEIK